MEKLKLYNWYGETFEAKLPETTTNLKAYKHQVKNVFTRLSENIKTRDKIERELFLRAKTKINDNLKRELSSHKVAYKNKLKVYKDSIKKLKFAENTVSLLKYELAKLKQAKKGNEKYVHDFIYSLEKSADELNYKINSITKLEQESNAHELELFKKYALYNTLLVHLTKTNNTSSFNYQALKPYLDSFEIQLFDKSSNPDLLLKETYEKLETKRASLLKQKQQLELKYQKILPLQKQLYKEERANIILKAKQTIVTLENEYNLKTEENKLKAYEYKQSSLEKIAKHKALIKENEARNTVVIKKIKKQAALSREAIKKQYPEYLKNQQSRMLERHFKDFQNFLIKEKLIVLNDLCKNVNDLEKYIANLKNDIITIKFNVAKKIFYSTRNLNKIKHEAKLISQSVYNDLISKTYQKVSYEADYKKEESKALREYFIASYKTRIKFLHEEILAKWELIDLKNSNAISQEKEFARLSFKRIDNDYFENLKIYKEKVKHKEITKQAFKNKKIEFKVKKQEAKYEVKLQSKILKNKSILRWLFVRQFAENKVNKKIYESKINEAQKTIPIETSRDYTLLATIFGFILPGLPEIIWYRQHLKGILMLLFTVICWTMLIPFSLGFYTNSMSGIRGFIDLGASAKTASTFPDSRYYLFGAVISVIFLSICLIYFVVSSIGARRVAISLYQGSRPSKWSHTKRWMQTSGFPWFISILGWVLMVFIVISPVITSILISFTNLGFNHEPPGKLVSWVGLEQWGKWWTLRKADLLSSIGNVFGWTIIWTITSTIFPIALGIIVAILANNTRIKGRKIFRIIYILPWAIPAFVTLGFMRNIFASGEFGLINFLLKKLFGMNARSWLEEIGTARILVILVQTWIGYAYIFMLVTGTLQSIPKDIYEAGSVDGAKGRHVFRYLTLPALLLAIAPMLIGQFVAAFNNFTTISVFTGGNPKFPYPTIFGEGSTDIIISWVYKLTTGNLKIDGNQAFAAALVTLTSLFSIGLAARGFVKSMSRKD
ncbi:ABC transporter permease subunit [Mycoplasma buteonis]|uniref:ABC transporter permease subunit n=1 Tax=Mycoplasma buteonis TaxID=171280 RepID=UPI0005607E03|nr:ABC transporter permease subunit [Mycoplasma buteonis]